MASERFPIVELNDALRQLWFVPPVLSINGSRVDPWQQLALTHPNWQLSRRRRFTLNVPGNPEQRYPLAPFKPPVPEEEDNRDLIRPVLFDNVNELGIAATSSSNPVTAVVVQYEDGQSVGLIDDTELKAGEQIASFSVFLYVFHQEAPKSRLMRYMNWFQHQATQLAFDRAQFSPRNRNTIRLSRLLGEADNAQIVFSKPAGTVSSGPISEIGRQATIGIAVECKMQLLNDDDLGGDIYTSDEAIFDDSLNSY